MTVQRPAIWPSGPGTSERCTAGEKEKGTHALRGVDIEVPRGVGFGLIGPNGAGKTTFIKTLLGIVHRTGGDVRLLGGDPADPKQRLRVGYLPERLQLPPKWLPLEFFRSVARLKRHPQEQSELDALLTRLGLAESKNKRIGGFSKGMRQRLALGAALIGNPDLLVLDEPTDGVDPVGRREIRTLLRQEIQKGCTVFLNSHLLAETERICDAVAIMKAGQVVRRGTLDQLCAEANAWVLEIEPDPFEHPNTRPANDPTTVAQNWAQSNPGDIRVETRRRPGQGRPSLHVAGATCRPSTRWWIPCGAKATCCATFVLLNRIWKKC